LENHAIIFAEKEHRLFHNQLRFNKMPKTVQKSCFSGRRSCWLPARPFLSRFFRVYFSIFAMLYPMAMMLIISEGGIGGQKNT